MQESVTQESAADTSPLLRAVAECPDLWAPVLDHMTPPVRLVVGPAECKAFLALWGAGPQSDARIQRWAREMTLHRLRYAELDVAPDLLCSAHTCASSEGESTDEESTDEEPIEAAPEEPDRPHMHPRAFLRCLSGKTGPMLEYDVALLTSVGPQSFESLLRLELVPDIGLTIKGQGSGACLAGQIMRQADLAAAAQRCLGTHPFTQINATEPAGTPAADGYERLLARTGRLPSHADLPWNYLRHNADVAPRRIYPSRPDGIVDYTITTPYNPDIVSIRVMLTPLADNGKPTKVDQIYGGVYSPSEGVCMLMGAEPAVDWTDNDAARLAIQRVRTIFLTDVLVLVRNMRVLAEANPYHFFREQ